MKKNIIVILCVLMMSIGLYGYVDASESEENLKQLMNHLVNMPEELNWDILDRLLGPVEKELIDHIRLLHQQKQRSVTEYSERTFQNGCYVAFSPDGEVIASGADDLTVTLWDVELGRRVRTFVSQGEPVACTAFSADGKTLVTVSYDSTIKLWDIETETLIKTLLVAPGSWISSAAFSREGRVCAIGLSDGSIKLWDVDRNTEIKTILRQGSRADVVALSSEGDVLATSENENSITVWRVANGEKIKTLSGHQFCVKAIAFSPDGTMLAAGASDASIKLWDLGTEREACTLPSQCDCVKSIAFSQDGKVLATGLSDKKVKLWNLYDKKDKKVIEILRNSYYKLGAKQKLLLYVLNVKKEAAENRSSVRLKDVEGELKELYTNCPIPELLHLVESYKSLPDVLREVVKDYFGVIE